MSTSLSEELTIPSAKAYILKVLEEIKSDNKPSHMPNQDVCNMPQQIFNILSSREFTYLTKTKSEPYKKTILENISQSYSGRIPLRFYMSLGGGYHARTQEKGNLIFDPGLGELLAFAQIKKFITKVKSLYPFGISFTIIIDNRCAEFSNSIPVKNTEGYSDKLKAYIQSLNLEKEIEVILESNLIKKEDFEHLLESVKLIPEISKISESDIKNANRFCRVFDEDILSKVKHYKAVNKVSRNLVVQYVKSNNGILLAQRANENAYAFRSFPGGDSKIQCGEVALLYEEKAIAKPVLITSKNFNDYKIYDINLSEDKYLLSKVKVLEKKIGKIVDTITH